MYNEKSKFVLVDRGNEVVEHYYGVTNLARKTLPLIKSGFIGSHFKHERVGWYTQQEWYNEFHAPYIHWNKSKVEWVVYDEDNHPVNIEFIRSIKPSMIPDWKRWRNQRQSRRFGDHNFTFRSDPVPKTGKGYSHRYDHGGYRSSVSFVNELRQSEGVGGIRVKRRAQVVYLRFDLKWDVYCRSTERDKKSWKKTKKRCQWM